VRTHVRNGKPSLSVVISGMGRCPPGTALSASQRKYVPGTIEDLFARVESFLQSGPEAARVEVKYDPSYGIPVYFRAENLMLTDSDQGFDIRDFAPHR